MNTHTSKLLGNGTTILMDGKVAFYSVKEGENLFSIRNKLKATPEFSYLNDEKYAPQDSIRNLKSFNIPAQDLKAGMIIPIPLNIKERSVDDETFYQESLRAIEEMKSDSCYKDSINLLLKNQSPTDLAILMCAFARSESAFCHWNGEDPIGNATLHRREPHMKAFSFSHYHILMEMNADGKSPGPGLKARKKLWLTEGQTYHPRNGGKLFLAYWIEKMKNKDFQEVFNIQSLKDAERIGKIYNGSSSYGEKLRTNIEYYRNTFK